MPILKTLGIAGFVMCILIVSARMRTGRLEGGRLTVALFALALWLVGLVFSFLHY